jgi:hypothetical protein
VGSRSLQRTFFEAELYRLKVSSLLMRSAPEAEAESLLDRALRTARSQQTCAFARSSFARQVCRGARRPFIRLRLLQRRRRYVLP